MTDETRSSEALRLVLPESALRRFFSKVEKTGTCWLWIAGRSSTGYGRFFIEKINGHAVVSYAHRTSFELHHRLLRPDETVDHLCFEPLCVNPAHLDACSAGENVRRWNHNGPGGHLQKTHCPKGHPYSGENLYVESDGGRKCRTCVYARNRERLRRHGLTPEQRERKNEWRRQWRAAARAARQPVTAYDPVDYPNAGPAAAAQVAREIEEETQ